MVRRRSHSVEAKRKLIQDHLAGETLYLAVHRTGGGAARIKDDRLHQGVRHVCVEPESSPDKPNFCCVAQRDKCFLLLPPCFPGGAGGGREAENAPKGVC